MSFRYNPTRPSGSSYSQGSSYGSSPSPAMPANKAYSSTAKPSYSSSYSKPSYTTQASSTSKPESYDTSVRSGYDSSKRYGDTKYESPKSSGYSQKSDSSSYTPKYDTPKSNGYSSKAESSTYRSDPGESKTSRRDDSKTAENVSQSRFGYTNRYDAKTQPRSESKETASRSSDAKDSGSRFGSYRDASNDSPNSSTRYSTYRDSSKDTNGGRYGGYPDSTSDNKDSGSRQGTYDKSGDTAARYGGYRDASRDTKDSVNRSVSMREPTKNADLRTTARPSNRYGDTSETEKESTQRDYSSLPRSYASDRSSSYGSRYLTPSNDSPRPYVRNVSAEPKEDEKPKESSTSLSTGYRPRYSRFLSSSSTATPSYTRSNSSQDGFTSPTSPVAGYSTSPLSPGVYTASLQIKTDWKLPLSPSRSPAPEAPPTKKESSEESSSESEESSNDSSEIIYQTCRATSPNMYACDPDPQSLSVETQIEKPPPKSSTIRISHKEVQTEGETDQPRKSRFIGYTGYSGPSYPTYTPSRPTTTYYDKYLSRNYTSNLTKYRDEPKEPQPPKKSPSPLALKPPPSPALKSEGADIKEKIKNGILDVLMYTSMAGRSLESVKRSPSAEKTMAKPPLSPCSNRKHSRSPSVENQLKPPLSPSSYRKSAVDRSPSSDRLGKPPVSPAPRKNSSDRCLSKLTPPRCLTASLPPLPKRQSFVSQKSSSDASSESETESSEDSKSSSKRCSRSKVNLPQAATSSESGDEVTTSSLSSDLASPPRNGSGTKFLPRAGSNASRTSLIRSGSNSSRSNLLQRNGSNASRTDSKPNVYKSASNASRSSLGSIAGSKGCLMQKSGPNVSKSSMLERSGSNASRSSLVQKSGGSFVQKSPSSVTNSRRSSSAASNPPQQISVTNSRSNSKSSLRSSSKADLKSSPRSDSRSSVQIKARSSSSEVSKTSSSPVSRSATKEQMNSRSNMTQPISNRSSQREPISNRSRTNLARPPPTGQRSSPGSSEASSRRGSVAEGQTAKTAVPQSTFLGRREIRRSSTLASDWWKDVPELSSSPEPEKVAEDIACPASDEESSTSSESSANPISEDAPPLPPPHVEIEKAASPVSELGDRTSPDGFEWPDDPVTPPPALSPRPILRLSPYDCDNGRDLEEKLEKGRSHSPYNQENGRGSEGKYGRGWSPQSEKGRELSPFDLENWEGIGENGPRALSSHSEKGLDLNLLDGCDGEVVGSNAAVQCVKSENGESSYESDSSESEEESLDEALSKAVEKEAESSEETEDDFEEIENSAAKALPPDVTTDSAEERIAETAISAGVSLRRKSEPSATEEPSCGLIEDSEKLLEYLRRLDAVNRISDHLAGSSGDEGVYEWPFSPIRVDDTTLQLYKDGDYGAYLDLECSLAEQSDELEGFIDNRKNSIVLRTQLAVRVNAIIEKLLVAEGRELRRALFALKQIFQDDKDLVHAFVENDGLSCMIKVGKQVDQNFQNYILRALGQVMLYVDGMHGVMEHNDTIRWLYELLGSRYRLVIKTALKLMLVFVEYVESNCRLLVDSIHAVDKEKGQMAWAGVMKLLDDADATDTELVIYAVTLINKTLHGLPDQDSFYDETDCLEELGMQSVIKKYLSRPGADLDLLQQFQLYEADLRREDGDDSPTAILPAIQPMARSSPRTKRYSDGSSSRRKSRRHLLACGDDSAASSPASSPKSLKPPMEFSTPKAEENDEESIASSSRSTSPAVCDPSKMQIDSAGETALIRRRRLRADRQRIFLREQGLRLGSDGESSMTDDSSASAEPRRDFRLESPSPLSTSPCPDQPVIPVRRISSKPSLTANESVEKPERPIELSREMTVKDITEKLKLSQCAQSSLGSPSEEKPARLGDLSGIISKAKEGLTKSKSKNDLKVETPVAKPELKKSENELQWEQLVRSLNRPLNICDLDFTDLNDTDDTDPLRLGMMTGIPPPPPPMMNGGLPPPGPPRMPPVPNGLPPPPSRGFVPPPVFGVKLAPVKSHDNVPGLENGSKVPKKTKKTVKLFWKEARDGTTIWDELKPVHVDTQKLEYLFEQRCAKDLVGKKISEGAKSKEIIVLDPKRSNAINIALTKLPPARAIKAAILKMDATVINREGIEKILALLPSEEEKAKIQEAATLQPDMPLGSAEQFLLTLSSITELLARLKLWVFRLDYENLEKEIAEPLMDLKIGIESLKNSKTFREILATLLTIGNYLNGSQAKGFQIDYLAKVPEVKDTVHKHSLLHHLCSMVMEKCPETTDLYSEIGPITRASRVDFEELATSLAKLESDCKASWDHLRAIVKHEQQGNIKVKMSEFLAECAERIIVLGIIYRRVMHRFQFFMIWLGTPNHIVRESKPSAICRIIAEFALEYRTTRERVLSQLEKRAAHRERNKTRGKMITEVGTFRREEDRADAELRHILASDMSDTESMSVRGTLSLGRRNKPVTRPGAFARCTSTRDGASDVCTSDAEDAILESLVKTVTAPSRPVMRERKRTRNADRKSLKRSRTRENNVFLPLLEDTRM